MAVHTFHLAKPGFVKATAALLRPPRFATAPGSEVTDPYRHANAMVERRRKDFHVEFTTLRYACIGEYGEWEGRRGIVPTGPVGLGSQACGR